MDEQASRLSRRHFLSGAAGAAGAAILAACGNGSVATDTPKPAAATGGPSTVSTSAAPSVIASSAPAANTAPLGPVSTAAPATPLAASVPKGGTLTIAATSDAKSFHPFQVNETASFGYLAYIHDGALVRYDENTLELVGNTAEKWIVSGDKKTYTFTLRDGLKWSDGVPMTTADYVWTFEQAKKPENKYPYLQNLEGIESYTATDPRTLVVTLKEALVVGLEIANRITYPLPKHIWEKLDWGDPTKNPEINAPTVGSGLWKLKEWKRDDHAIFVANDLYWDGRPNIDSITVRIFGTQALAYQALKSGEIDYSSFQPSDYKEAKTLSNVTIYEWYSASSSWQYIGYNLRRPALKDPLVRKAIAYATDRQGIIDSVVYGLARPIYSAFPQSSWVYNSNVEHYDFNLDKAKELLKQAGYTLNGKKLTKDGQQLSLKLLFGPASSKTREGIATVTQQQLGDLGIAVDVQVLEFQAFLDAIEKEPFDYDLFVLGWSASLEPHFGANIWAESSIPRLNSGAYINKQVEQLFDQGSKEFDREKRKAIYGQIQKIIADDEPYVFLYESQSYTGINKRVGGIVPTKLGIQYNLNKWYIKK